MIMEYRLERGAVSQIPDRIVVHAMGEFLEGGDRDLHATEFLKNIGLSAHILITPSGNVIRCRGDKEGAYHAKGYNINSLGIEFLVPGVHTMATFLDTIKGFWLRDEQYKAGLRIIKEWHNRWDMKHMDRHSDLSPGRKQDPGYGFPWNKLKEDVKL